MVGYGFARLGRPDTEGTTLRKVLLAALQLFEETCDPASLVVNKSLAYLRGGKIYIWCELQSSKSAAHKCWQEDLTSFYQRPT